MRNATATHCFLFRAWHINTSKDACFIVWQSWWKGLGTFKEGASAIDAIGKVVTFQSLTKSDTIRISSFTRNALYREGLIGKGVDGGTRRLIGSYL